MTFPQSDLRHWQRTDASVEQRSVRMLKAPAKKARRAVASGRPADGKSCPFHGTEISARPALKESSFRTSYITWARARKGRAAHSAACQSSQDAFALEIVRDVVQRALEPLADLLDLGGFDHQRWSKYQPVADHPQNEPVTLGGGFDARAHIE